MATLLESVEDIRALVQRQRGPVGPTVVNPPAPGAAAPAAREAPPVPEEPGGDTERFRPSVRPPIAWLCALDDGEDDGEVVRVRTTPFVIGRAEGDLVIPHDGGMSARHAEIVRWVEDGRTRWMLRDLGSTNGTFVRASSSILKDGQELLIGGLRLRFVLGVAAEAQAAAPSPAATAKWQAVGAMPGRGSAPELVVLTTQGDGRRHRLAAAETWIGRDANQCSVALDHPFVSPRHARVVRDDRGRWIVHNNRSLNGLWVRVQEVPLERGGQFQCGEQRFLIRVP